MRHGRGERDRTSDLGVPSAARYQTALHPDRGKMIIPTIRKTTRCKRGDSGGSRGNTHSRQKLQCRKRIERTFLSQTSFTRSRHMRKGASLNPLPEAGGRCRTISYSSYVLYTFLCRSQSCTKNIRWGSSRNSSDGTPRRDRMPSPVLCPLL